MSHQTDLAEMDRLRAENARSQKEEKRWRELFNTIASSNSRLNEEKYVLEDKNKRLRKTIAKANVVILILSVAHIALALLRFL
ncbi:MAG: hypothetical protein EBZ48_13350 [Proteobacteria bacterium]|nr:hypothetical protein [Pseudomonadota bacterium]